MITSTLPGPANGERLAVYKMSQEKFLDWDVLKAHITRRVTFFGSCFFRLTENFLQRYGCGNSYDSYEPHMDTKANILKGQANDNAVSTFDLSTVPVSRKYLAPLSLNPAKHKDLRELLQRLVPVRHAAVLG